MPFSWSCSSSSYAASTASACSTGAASTFLIRSTRASTGVKLLKSTATAMVTPFFAVLLDLNELLSTRHAVVLPRPLALYLDPVLRRRLAREARIDRLERIAALLRKHFDLDRGLLERRRIRRVVCVRSGQDVDRTLGRRELRQIHLIAKHAFGDQYLDLQRTVTAGDTHPPPRLDVSVLRQFLGDLHVPLRRLLVDTGHAVGHVALMEVLEDTAVIQEQIKVLIQR